jgi:hypothetical protein
VSTFAGSEAAAVKSGVVFGIIGGTGFPEGSGSYNPFVAKIDDVKIFSSIF